MVTVALLITSCVTSVSHNCRWGPTVVKIRYEVTSTAGSVDIEVLDAEGEVVRYRRERTSWRLTERVLGDSYVRLRVRNSRPLGTVSAAIYVDDVLWKKETGVGAGTLWKPTASSRASAAGIAGTACSFRRGRDESEKPEEPIGDPAIGGR